MTRHHPGSFASVLTSVSTSVFIVALSSYLPARSTTRLSDSRIETRVDALLQKMTLEEKVNQLVQRVGGSIPTGTAKSGGGWEGPAARSELGSLFGLTDPELVNAIPKGAAEAGRDYNTVDISERTLRQVYLPPFHAAVEAGAATLMSGFNPLNGVPASANAYTIKQILKEEWAFQGFVVSDYTAVAELIP